MARDPRRGLGRGGFDDDADPGGGAWRRSRPRFDDFMSWSVRLARVTGVDVRIHLLYIVFVVVQLLRAAFPAADPTVVRLGFTMEALVMAILFVIVLLHEFGHVLACRAVGGVADEVLMWPLGGLARATPPDDWRSHLVTTLGGPAVNVLVMCVAAPALGLLTGEWLGVALPNPLNLVGPLLAHGNEPTVQILFLFNWISFSLLLFNAFPMFPMDMGRALQELLWARVGYATSMRYATRAGIVAAVVLAVLGAVVGEWLIIAVALFGGVTCFQMMRQLEYTEADLASADPMERVYAESLERSRREDREDERRSQKERQRDRQRDATRLAEEEARRAKEETEFNRILDKIREFGMASLTAGERRTLERETERRRGRT